MDGGSGRTSLNFSKKAVLTVSEGGYTHDTEESVKPDPNENPSNGGNLFQSDIAKLASRGNVSLYDQLQTNKEAKEEEWHKSHNMFATQKPMDQEELDFIKDQERQKQERRAKLDEQEKNELAAFAYARANKTIATKTPEHKPVSSQPNSTRNKSSLLLGSKQTGIKLIKKVVKRKAQEGNDDENDSSKKPKTLQDTTKTGESSAQDSTVNQSAAPLSGGLLALGGYSSDESSDE